MLRRITTTILAALAALSTLVGSAWALPGEGYGVDPYGIPTADVPGGGEPVLETVTGWVLSPVVLVTILVLTAAVMAAAGYWTGGVRQRRLALR